MAVLKKVDKVVALAVCGAIGIVWVLLVGFDAFRTLAIETTSVGQGTYTLTKAVGVVLLTVPRRAYEWFVFSALIGSLLGLGTLAASGELTALRAAGMSKLRICLSVALSVVAFTVMVVAVGETIAPAGDQKSQSLLLQSKSNDVALSKASGVWARDGSTVINAKRASARQTEAGREVHMSDVRIFEFTDKGQLTSISIAKSAEHAAGKWVMHDLRRTKFEGASAVSTTSATEEWKSGLDPRMLSLSILRPEYMSIRDLNRGIDYLHRNHQDSQTLEVAFWARIFYPLNALLLAFSAVPFAFGALRSGGLGKRIFLGIVMAVAWYFSQRALVNLGAVYGVHLAVANLIPALILGTLIVLYFRKYA